MIFTVYALTKSGMVKMSGNSNNDAQQFCSFGFSPHLQLINFSAVERSDKTFADVVLSPPQFNYSTAEQAIDRKFMQEMKNIASVLHCSIVVVVVDESHTVEMWGD